MTSKDTTSAIFSQELEGGATRSDSPDGPTTDLFGAPAVPARRSPSPASKRSALSAKARVLCGALEELVTQYALTANTLGLPTPATYGRKFGDSPRNLDLDAYSENRLTAWEHSTGSPLYRHRLRYSVTPLGRRVFQLRASERPISDSGCGGWPTPTASTGGPEPEGTTGRKLPTVAGWATPTSRDHKDGASDLTNTPVNSILGRQVCLSPATTTKRGQLAPEFSGWLMGFPVSWMKCAPSKRK